MLPKIWRLRTSKLFYVIFIASLRPERLFRLTGNECEKTGTKPGLSIYLFFPVGEAVQHRFAPGQPGHRLAVVLLVQEEAGFLAVFKEMCIRDRG